MRWNVVRFLYYKLVNRSNIHHQKGRYTSRQTHLCNCHAFLWDYILRWLRWLFQRITGTETGRWRRQDTFESVTDSSKCGFVTLIFLWKQFSLRVEGILNRLRCTNIRLYAILGLTRMCKTVLPRLELWYGIPICSTWISSLLTLWVKRRDLKLL